MKPEEAIELVINELEKAERKHPGWTVDVIHGLANLSEETGEAVKAGNDFVFGDGSYEDIITELAHSGAMSLRNLMYLTQERAENFKRFARARCGFRAFEILSRLRPYLEEDMQLCTTADYKEVVLEAIEFLDSYEAHSKGERK